MFFESFKSILFSDTLLPDIFITEYMPSMDSDFLKVYIHCLFLSKHNKQVTTKELSKKLEIEVDKVKNALIYLESVGLIYRKESNNSIVMTDLKEKEINKMYRPKTTSTPEEAVFSSTRNKKRNEIVSAINNKFFQGLMAPSWYTDIDSWFDKYQFEEDVMFMLFQYCYDHNKFSKNYIVTVAESWNRKNIHNEIDLGNYMTEYDSFKDIRGKIVKKLKLTRNLTEYEDKFVEKWFVTFKYDFEIVEMALKKTTSKTNPNFNYIDAIISEWNKNGLRTKEEILEYEKNRKSKATKTTTAGSPSVPQRGNFEQRKYDDEYFNSLYKNVGNKK
jgi:DnaD/phage-associated family protein